MPPGGFRALACWALETHQPQHHAFTQLLGINQLVTMTTTLLGPLARTPEQWVRLSRLAAIMNAWQVHEVFSDNLAMGLGFPPEFDDDPEAARRRLLHAFDREIHRTLESRAEGSRPAPGDLSRVFAGGDADISIFEQSLASGALEGLARQFVAQHPSHPLPEIDHDVSSILVANVLSCAEVVDAVEHPALAEMISSWLCRRYASVDVLLRGRPLELSALLEHGTRTILVVPTLGYYAGGLVDSERLTAALDAGLLPEALRLSALLLRLLNDLGTTLLTSSSQRTRARCRELASTLLARRGEVPCIADALLYVRDDAATRLLKDARFREFNVALHGLSHREVDPVVVEELTARIEHCAAVYREQSHALSTALEQLTRCLGDPRCSLMLRSFVEFHEVMYRCAYDSSAGDYAI